MLKFEEWSLNDRDKSFFMGGTGPATPEAPGDLDDPPPA